MSCAKNFCPGCIDRRRFLAAGCIGCGTALAKMVQLSTLQAGQVQPVPQQSSPEGKADRPKVRLIFACWALVQDRPTWPHIGHDMRPEIERVSKELPRLCPEVEFVPVVLHSPEEAEKLLAEDAKTGQIDGYLVYHMNNWIRVMYPVVASGKPTIIAQYIYGGSGGFHVFTAELRRNYKNMAAISSSRLEDLAEAARKFCLLRQGASASEVAQAAYQCHLDRMPPPRLLTGKEDKLTLRSIGEVLAALEKELILTVGGGSAAIAKALAETLKIQVRPVSFPEFAEAYERTDVDQARQIAARWKTQAAKIDIPEPDQTLEKSARVYLAQKQLMAKYKASAIAINCLGGFYSGHLKGYPCLGFVELNDAGLVGACEADLMSTGVMLMLRHLVGRPGYISDPVLDSSRRQIIYAHCVAPTKVFGPSDTPSAFEIYTHSEDRRGASVRSILPLGYMTTTLEIHPIRQEILCHRGVAVENPWSDRGCRTKLAVEVLGDFDRMYTFWDHYGWHRVTVYGDLWEPLKELAAALKFKFIPEAS
ncbi:MAG: hypothetical protein NZ602_13895 [Thermoguttaceae bacterium]|nr:hypothetical protein [Thermoguttaceae bacterium]MDW8039488.1 hypothetical protein [Thermoguttaceae bacterium]